MIADNCAEFANQIFSQSADMNGSTLLLGVLFFTFQIYGDFSGYSDIAIGTARLFGFNLMQNFAHPFFSRNVPEFWRRWHISMTTWFRDYLFIPLLKKFPINNTTKVMNVFTLFIVIGLWHGSSWNFVMWGVFLALVFLPSLFLKKRKMPSVVAKGKTFPSFIELYQMTSTFTKFVIAMIFFRAQTIEQIFNFFQGIFSSSLFEFPNIPDVDLFYSITLLIIIFILVEWQGREQKYAIEHLGLKWKKQLRYGMYYLIIFSILWFAGKEQEFIYFQF